MISDYELQEHLNDGVKRLYINYFQDVGDGIKYKGEWSKDGKVRDGIGTQVWPDGSKFEGMWRNGQQHGKGRMTHADGNIYQGDFKYDKANGQGILMNVDGAFYDGEWKDD